MSHKYLLTSTLFLFVGGWLIFGGSLWMSEEQQVRRAYRELLDLATISADIPPLERIFVAKRLTEYFSDQVKGVYVQDDLELQEQELSKKKLEEMFLGAYRMTREVQPKVISERLDDTTSSDVSQTLYSKLRVYGGHREQEENFLEEFDLTLSYEREEGDWVIKDVRVERIDR